MLNILLKTEPTKQLSALNQKTEGIEEMGTKQIKDSKEKLKPMRNITALRKEKFNFDLNL